jgi:hypothetical protein
MHGLVDIVRLSPQGIETLAMLDRFRANQQGTQQLALTEHAECNGYWRRVAGLELVQ